MAKKRILILTANPKDTLRLRLDQEVREIQEGLRRAQRRDDFEVHPSPATRLHDIRRAMLDIKPDIVHFCGHGEGEGGLAFENNAGQAQFVSAEALAGLFELFADNVECVVLNACYSRIQAEAIAQHVDYVVGMKQRIEDEAAIEFATAFYDALGAGESLQFAYKLGCKALQMIGIPEDLTPVLLQKRQIATAFLAYHPADATFVERIANALCQRGIMSLLDMHHLPPGAVEVDQLKTAVRRQIAIMPVLSKHVWESETDQKDVRELALLLQNERQYTKWVFPVDLEASANPETIADTVSQHIYKLLNFKKAKALNIVIDQRGDAGTFRKDPYTFPQLDNPAELKNDLAKLATLPTLVFRPDMGERSRIQLLTKGKWEQFYQTVKQSLPEALGNLTTQKVVRILGDFQLGIAFLLGQHFDRTTPVTLYCYNTRYKTRFDNSKQSDYQGNANCERTAEDEQEPSLPPKLCPGDPYPTVALYIGKRDYLGDVQVHLNTESPRLPLVFVETIKRGNTLTADMVMPLIRDIIALLGRLKDQNNTSSIRLYCDLPNNVLPLLAAELTWQVMPHIEFMERDPQASSPQEMYVHLPMK